MDTSTGPPPKKARVLSMGLSKSANVANNQETLIESLTPTAGIVCIRARVVSKIPIRSWANGVLFSCILADATSEIRMTAFDDVARNLHPQIEVKKVSVIFLQLTCTWGNKTIFFLNIWGSSLYTSTMYNILYIDPYG